MKNRLFEIWFALCCGPRNREFQTLLELAGSPYELYNADEAEIDRLPCSPSLRTKLADKSLSEATRVMKYCERHEVKLLFWQDGDYPSALRPLQDPPVLLYYKGNLPELAHRLCISVVGTRNMSEYGKRMSYKIGYELGSAGAVVVSGMALGNDSVAAAGAILAGGSTIAVLGCGIDTVYPREHEKLFSGIAENGAVMTEFAPGTPPEKMNFPIRNRLISGLSQGTVVIEADARSGALITARTAILQGRGIYAVPGNVGETNTSGTNRLISDGAAMILRARDVLEDYAFLYRDTLDLSKLAVAEALEDVDEEGLDRLGVSTRSNAAKNAENTRTAPPASRLPTGASRTAQSGADSRSFVANSHTAPRPSPPSSAPSPAPQRRAAPPPQTSACGDASERILKSLSDTQRKLFELLPLDHAVTIDYLTREGYTVGEIMAAMTVLEIKGLTVTLPGGLYSRK